MNMFYICIYDDDDNSLFVYKNHQLMYVSYCCELQNMDQFHSSATVDELLNALLDTIIRLKDLVKKPKPDCFVLQFL